MSFFLPPCLILLWPSERLSWPSTAKPIKEVTSFPCEEYRSCGKKHGGEVSRLDLADVFPDSGDQPEACPGILVFLEANFCASQNPVRPETLATGPRVLILVMYVSKQEQPRGLGVWAVWTTTRRLTSWPRGCHHLQVPPQALLFSLKQAGIVPRQKMRLGFTDLFLRQFTQSFESNECSLTEQIIFWCRLYAAVCVAPSDKPWSALCHLLPGTVLRVLVLSPLPGSSSCWEKLFVHSEPLSTQCLLTPWVRVSESCIMSLTFGASGKSAKGN